MSPPFDSQGSADPLPKGQEIGEPLWKDGEGNRAPLVANRRLLPQHSVQ